MSFAFTNSPARCSALLTIRLPHRVCLPSLSAQRSPAAVARDTQGQRSLVAPPCWETRTAAAIRAYTRGASADQDQVGLRVAAVEMSLMSPVEYRRACR